MVKMGVESITTDRPEFIRHGLQTQKAQARILQHLEFDDQTSGPAGVKGRALSLAELKTGLNTGKTLPASGTVAMWYRPTQWYDYQTVFDSTADPDVWELWINKDAQIGFRTTRKDLRMTHRLHPVATVNQWQHLAVTWDERMVHLYVNAAPVVSAKRKQPSTPRGDFCLGGGNAGNTPGKGHWDEVVVWDTVLIEADAELPVPADSEEGRLILKQHAQGANKGWNKMYKDAKNVINKKTERGTKNRRSAAIIQHSLFSIQHSAAQPQRGFQLPKKT